MAHRAAGFPLAGTSAILVITIAVSGCASTGAGDSRPTPTAHMVYGMVMDAAAGAAITGAHVEVLTASEAPVATTSTDSLGRFTVGTPRAAQYIVRFRHEAYVPMRTSIIVPDNQIVEVRAKLRASREDSLRSSVRVREFGTNRCTDWSNYNRVRGIGQTTVEWRWRLCDDSDDEYEVQVEFRNPRNDTIEFRYRGSGQPSIECAGLEHSDDYLSANLFGQLTLGPDARGRHRGRRGVAAKNEYTSFILCVYDWRTIPPT